MRLILNLLLSSAFVYGTATLLPGMQIADFLTAILVVVILAFLNFILKPILVALTIPVTILTFGLFLLVINAIIVLLADYLVPGFDVLNFGWALIFSLIISLFNSIIYK